MKLELYNPLITIDGTPTADNRRVFVEIDDVRIALRARSFRVLAILALGRRFRTGWVLALALIAPGDLASRYLHRLKREIECACPADHDLLNWPVYERAPLLSHTSSYRLLTTPEQIIVSNPNALKEFGDHDILSLLTPDELRRITM